jgi:hypothetical protein
MKLKAIIRTYIRKVRPRARDELDWFHQQPSLRTAIEKAALAVNRKGKRYRHQCRLQRASLEQAHRVLLANSRTVQQARDFDDLFNRIDRILGPIPGIGELYVYDTSLRIGAKLNLLPTKVYLHAGTRVGARALGLDGSAATLKVSALPQEFCSLEPHEIEDILCIFKGELKTLGNKRITGDIAKRSSCN